MSSFKATVYYNPSLYHYVSRGWGEAELISGRMHTPGAIRGPLLLSPPSPPPATDPTRCPSSPTAHAAPPALSLQDLKQAVVRSLFAAYVDSLPCLEEPAGSEAGGDVQAAVERWAGLVLLRVGNTYLVPDTGEEQDVASWEPQPTDGTHLRVYHARTEHVLKPASARSPAKRDGSAPAAPVSAFHNALSQQHQQQHDSASNVSATHVCLDGSSFGTVIVVSFLQESEWREQRRAHRSAQHPPNLALQKVRTVHDTPDSRAPAEAIFTAEEDRAFAAWLSAKRAVLTSWSLHWRRRTAFPQLTAAVLRGAAHQPTSSPSSPSSSASSSSTESPAAHSLSPPPIPITLAEREQRRRTMLAAIEARRRKR